jgi:hypothetical protein
MIARDLSQAQISWGPTGGKPKNYHSHVKEQPIESFFNSGAAASRLNSGLKSS